MSLYKVIMTKKIKFILLILCLLFVAGESQAQNIPEEYRGDAEQIFRGVLDGNLIETNFRNHGELSRWMDIPWGVWPRSIGGRHIDGVGVVVAGYVDAPRSESIATFADYKAWNDTYQARGAISTQADTLLNPLIINYREAGRRVSPYSGATWGWLPLPGFHNEFRIDPNTLNSTPTPALSTDNTSWPDFWPNRLDEDDPGWPGTWNGRDGRFPSADLESFYVIDDYSDLEYAVGLETTGPHSTKGVYHPSPVSDLTKGGFGLQMQVRLFQWANVLAEDTMFLIYRISNKGDYTQNRLYFSQIVDYGLGNEENDDNASFDDLLDVVYGWDTDGIGTPTTGGSNYNLGYTGFAFLESPANDNNMEDDDMDGITDESRFDENYMLFTTLEEIQNYTVATYNLNDFEIFHGETVEQRPAAKALKWYTTDENLDWVGFSDENEDGIWNVGESLNNDVGRDGLGPFDLDYPGPDAGQGDGIPTNGEPNYNELDVDESDQIGLTGFDLDTRPVYESGDNLRDDTWLFEKIQEHLFSNPDYETPSTVANNEPFILFVSGEVQLSSTDDPNGKSTDFFSTAWIFGDDQTDFFKNRRTVQNIYNADYNFAQPPIIPTLTAVGGDGQVILSWDRLSVQSFDRFLQEFDFEGYKVYKSTDNIFNSARTITDSDGIPTFYDPIAQFDLDNDISGLLTVLEGEAVYNLGDNTGLQFNYVDNDVINGKTYYYAVVAYDRGIIPSDTSNADGIDPQENTFRVAIGNTGEVTGTSKNTAVVIPTTLAAGYVQGGASVDLNSVTSGSGTGFATLDVVIESELNDSLLYEVTFTDSASTSGDFRITETYTVTEATKGTTKIDSIAFETTTSIVDGFTLNFFNDGSGELIETRTGYVANEGDENETFSTDPTTLDGLSTDWVVSIAPNDEGDETNFTRTDSDFELLFVNPEDSTYTPPFGAGGGPFGVGFSRFPIPLFARNINSRVQVAIYIRDTDENETLSVGDELFVSEPNTDSRLCGTEILPSCPFQKFRFKVSIESGSIAPSPGDKIRISTTRAFGSDDVFRFGIIEGRFDNELASSQLEDIYVAPNPYVGAASWERVSQSFGRGERKINFFNLPQKCTIRIFNIRGELLRTLEHEGNDFNDGSISWDLLTDNSEDIAYGVYFYHVEAPGIGEYTDKFAIVK